MTPSTMGHHRRDKSDPGGGELALDGEGAFRDELLQDERSGAELVVVLDQLDYLA